RDWSSDVCSSDLLVDCEFLVHFLQLRERTAFEPTLGDAIHALVDADLMPASFAVHQALLGRLLVAARLLAPDGQPPHETPQAALARARGQPDYPALLQALGEARHGVATAWAELFGETLEIAGWPIGPAWATRCPTSLSNPRTAALSARPISGAVSWSSSFIQRTIRQAAP